MDRLMETPPSAVDIWSVGCIMAELLQGKVLFPGNDCILGPGYGGGLSQGPFLWVEDKGVGSFRPVLLPVPHAVPPWAHGCQL